MEGISGSDEPGNGHVVGLRRQAVDHLLIKGNPDETLPPDWGQEAVVVPMPPSEPVPGPVEGDARNEHHVGRSGFYQRGVRAGLLDAEPATHQFVPGEPSS